MKRLRALRRWFARRFGYARLVCLVLLVGIAALRIADPPPIEELRVRTFDTFQRVDHRVKTARPVTIIDIDERSLTKFGQWPWPRTRIADLVASLTRLGAVAIGFDIMFAEPDRLNPEAAADTFRNLDEETRFKLRALPSNDQVLADAMRRSRVILGETGLPDILSDLDKTLPVTGLAMLGEEPQRFMYEFTGLLRNTPVLEAAAGGRGLLTINPERDGIIRRVPMIMKAQGVTMPSLSFEMLRVVTGTDTIFIKADKAGIQSLGVKGFQIPTDPNGQLWVHFARSDPSIYVSATAVLEGSVPPEMIESKLILIGTSAVGLNDIKTTPVSAAMPGVEIHAQVLEAALTKSLLAQPPYGPLLEFGSALLLGILVIIFAPKFGPITLVVVGALFATVLIGTSWYFYTMHRLLVDFTYPLLSTTSIYLTLIFSNGFVTPSRRKRRQITLRLRPVPVARFGRAARAVAGEAPARRRVARDDHHVLRRARLHHHFGSIQERSAGSHHADEPLPDPADQCHSRPQGDDRQIYGRRHHGVLECAARRQGTPAQCLRSRSSRHAVSGSTYPLNSEDYARSRRRRPASPLFRSMSASV